MPDYVIPKTFREIGRSGLFYVAASASMAAGAGMALLRSTIPFRKPAPGEPSPKKAAMALATGVAGVPFFTAVTVVEAGLLFGRRVVAMRED